MTDEILQMLAAAKAKRRAEEIRIARENLAKYGDVLPPLDLPGVAAPAPSKAKPRGSAAGPRKHDPKWDTMKKKCAHCGKTKLVGPDFGVIHRGDKEYGYSWCKDCRSSTAKDYRESKKSPKTKGKRNGA